MTELKSARRPRSRRTFLLECTAAAATAAIAPAAVWGKPSITSNRPIDELGLVEFAKLLNTTFQACQKAESSTPLELVRAIPSTGKTLPNSPDSAHEKFSLLFQGPKDRALTQDTYSFEHAQLGRFQMFITRVGRPDQEHCFYEAVFSRPPRPADDNYQV